MLAFSRFSPPLENSPSSFVLFDFLASFQSSKVSPPASPKALSKPVRTAEIIESVTPPESPRKKKSVSFSESVRVRTFKVVEEEEAPATAAPAVVEKENSASSANMKEGAALRAHKLQGLSYEQSPYFQTFQAESIPSARLLYAY